MNGHDPFLELGAQAPRDTVRFMRMLLSVGSFASLAVLCTSCPHLYHIDLLHRSSSWLNRAMYAWLSLVCAVYAAQLPLRAYLITGLPRTLLLQPRAAVLAALRALLDSAAWRAHRLIGHAASGLFLIGSAAASLLMAFGLPSGCEPDPSLARTTLISLAIFAGRIAFGMALFAFDFIYANDVPGLKNGRAAGEDAIAALKSFTWRSSTTCACAHVARPRRASCPVGDQLQLDSRPTSTAAECVHTAAALRRAVAIVGSDLPRTPTLTVDLNPPSTCAICLADLEGGQVALRLPCAASHVFHDGCIKQWLRISKKCPLCTQDIDEPHDKAS